MLTQNVTPEQLQAAAHQVGVKLSGLRPERGGYRFTLKTDSQRFGYPDRKTGEGGAPYRRISQNYGMDRNDGRPRTVPGAVCWHGHRDFFRALYARAPEARIITAMTTYTGAAQFERTFRDTRSEGGERMGYRMRPYEQACYCGE